VNIKRDSFVNGYDVNTEHEKKENKSKQKSFIISRLKKVIILKNRNLESIKKCLLISFPRRMR